MSTPNNDGSTRIGQDRDFTPTQSGADVTSRMAGTDSTRRDTHLSHAKTSAAATFALVFGLAALFCALTGILAPAAIVFGIIGIVLGIAGLKMSKRPGVTGHGVAIGGLVTAVLGLLLGGLVTAGAAAIVNDDAQLDRISNKIDQLRDDVPSGDQVQDAVTPN
jgi:hypothetical protein